MNQKTSWISISNNFALWYIHYSWRIGRLDELGTGSSFIASTGNQGILSCPYDVPNDAWKYGSGGWIIADANDISIECLAGNEFNNTVWHKFIGLN